MRFLGNCTDKHLSINRFVHFPCFAVLLTAICNYNFRRNKFFSMSQLNQLNWNFHSVTTKIHFGIWIWWKIAFSFEVIIKSWIDFKLVIGKSIKALMQNWIHLFNESLSINMLIALILDEWWHGTDLLLLAYNRLIVKMRYNQFEICFIFIYQGSFCFHCA